MSDSLEAARACLLRARGLIDSARTELDAAPMPTLPPESTWDIPAYGQVALRDLLSGVTELPGRPAHPRIKQALATTTHPSQSDETPWCSAIMCLWMAESGLPHTRSAAARSWLDWGRERDGEMQPWDVCVLWRGSPSSRSGHVGLGLARSDRGIWLLGGNQGNSVSLKWYPDHRLLSVRRP